MVKGRGADSDIRMYTYMHIRIYAYSGMTPTIRAVLSNLLGEEDSKDIEIVSNEVDIHEDGTWSIKYRHPSRCVLARVLPGNVLSH